MDSEDHSLDGTDPDEWDRRKTGELIAELDELKSMSPADLRHYGGSPSFTKKRKTASQGGT